MTLILMLATLVQFDGPRENRGGKIEWRYDLKVGLKDARTRIFTADW